MIRAVLCGAAMLWAALSAAPVSATQNGWPALHDVSGVTATDVLNIRERPSADAPIIGTLAPDATDIEVVRPNDRHTWGEVNVGDRQGWASLSYLARQPGQWLGAPLPLARCSGTEPFWALSFPEAGEAVLSFPTGAATALRVISYQAAQNRRDRFGLTLREGEATHYAILTHARCSDGMSDRAYGLTLDLILTNAAPPEVYSGCCSLSE